MTTIGYMALHYGEDYIEYAIASVIDDLDQLYILYSATPSHGHSTDLICPDSRAKLYDLAFNASQGKLTWIDGAWAHEGYQRDAIFSLAPQADTILVLDSDEIWQKGLARQAINAIQQSGHKQMRLPFIHYWRSFHRGFLHDPAYPVRLFNLKGVGETTLSTPDRINHMGYAQRSEVVRYKMTIHGHKNELKPNWFETTFAPNRQTDCHPVGSDYWNVEEINPWLYMPDFMSDHPYAELEIIP